jgi:hypothetical protein
MWKEWDLGFISGTVPMFVWRAWISGFGAEIEPWTSVKLWCLLCLYINLLDSAQPWLSNVGRQVPAFMESKVTFCVYNST